MLRPRLAVAPRDPKVRGLGRWKRPQATSVWHKGDATVVHDLGYNLSFLLLQRVGLGRRHLTGNETVFFPRRSIELASSPESDIELALPSTSLKLLTEVSVFWVISSYTSLQRYPPLSPWYFLTDASLFLLLEIGAAVPVLKRWYPWKWHISPRLSFSPRVYRYYPQEIFNSHRKSYSSSRVGRNYPYFLIEILIVSFLTCQYMVEITK